MCDRLLCPHAEGARGLWRRTLTRSGGSANPFRGLYPRGHTASSRPHLLTPSPWGLGFDVDLGDTDTRSGADDP